MEKQNQNLKVIHSFFEAYAVKDMKKLESILHPEVKWYIPGEHPLSGVKSGKDQVLEYFLAMEKYSFHASNLVLGCNQEYVIDCHQNWTDYRGDRFEGLSCLLWKINQGKIVEVINFPENQKNVNEFFNRNPL